MPGGQDSTCNRGHRNLVSDSNSLIQEKESLQLENRVEQSKQKSSSSQVNIRHCSGLNHKCDPDGIVQAELKKGSSGHKCDDVFEEIVSEDTRINSGSLGRVPIKVMNSNSERPTEYVVELNNLQGILTARAVTKETGFTDVINCNNSTFHLKPNAVIGTAVETDEVILGDSTEADESLSVRKSFTCSEESDDSKLALVSTLSDNVCVTEDSMTKQEINDAKEVAELPLVSQPSANSNSKDRVSLNHVTDHMPEHLKELFSQTMKGPPIKHLTVTGTLLIEYQDIFAQHDLDIGCLKALKHKIDTGSAVPVKQRMRRFRS